MYTVLYSCIPIRVSNSQTSNIGDGYPRFCSQYITRSITQTHKVENNRHKENTNGSPNQLWLTLLSTDAREIHYNGEITRLTRENFHLCNLSLSLTYHTLTSLSHSLTVKETIKVISYISRGLYIGNVWIQGSERKWESGKCHFPHPLSIQTPEKKTEKSLFLFSFSFYTTIFSLPKCYG